MLLLLGWCVLGEGTSLGQFPLTRCCASTSASLQVCPCPKGEANAHLRDRLTHYLPHLTALPLVVSKAVPSARLMR